MPDLQKFKDHEAEYPNALLLVETETGDFKTFGGSALTIATIMKRPTSFVGCVNFTIQKDKIAEALEKIKRNTDKEVMLVINSK